MAKETFDRNRCGRSPVMRWKVFMRAGKVHHRIGRRSEDVVVRLCYIPVVTYDRNLTARRDARSKLDRHSVGTYVIVHGARELLELMRNRSRCDGINKPWRIRIIG